jgi:hypothetical protein
MQWRAPLPPPRTPTVGVKRDANGTPVDRERTPVPARARTVDRQPSTPAADDKSGIVLFSVTKSPGTATPTAVKESKAAVPSDSEMDLDEPPAAPDATLNVAQSTESYMGDDDDDGLTENDLLLPISIARDKRERLQSRLVDPQQHSVSISRALEKIVMLSGILGIGHVLPLPDFFLDPVPFAEPVRFAEPDPSPTAAEPTAEPPARPMLPQNGSSTSTAQAGPVRPLSPTPARDDVVMEDADKDPSPEPTESPELAYLPFVGPRLLTPLSDPDSLKEVDENANDCLLRVLEVMDELEVQRQRELRTEYAQKYRSWLLMVAELDKSQRGPEIQPIEKQVDVEMVDVPLDPNPSTSTPTLGGRQHKFGSQFDLERALEESLREEERRKERADKENKDREAPSEREAVIPDRLSPEEALLRMFQDTSLCRRPQDALRVFEFAPPEDTLTEEQDRKLRLQYDKDVKAWHKLADFVGSTTKACINHYYATKWDRPYKSAKKKRKKTDRKGANRMRVDMEPDQTDVNMGVTETGRPRRAAAPTFSRVPALRPDGDADGEGQAAAAAPAGRKVAANAKLDGTVNGEEKVARRGKTKEKQPKKRKETVGARSQAQRARKGAAAAEPEELPWAGKSESVPPEEKAVELVGPPQYLQHSYSSQQFPQSLQHGSPPHPQVPHPQFMEAQSPAAKPDMAPALPTGERPRSQSQSQRHITSSYWSVHEEQIFKACLTWYGKDFAAIATHMGKKTPVMVSNCGGWIIH